MASSIRRSAIRIFALAGALLLGVAHPVASQSRVEVLHSFGNDPLNTPVTLIRAAEGDDAGTYYGITASGGAFGNGALFSLTPDLAGNFSLQVLHDFRPQDGVGTVGLAEGPDGVYGVAPSGGAYGLGTLYRVTAAGEFTVLHHYDGVIGAGPHGRLYLAQVDGTFYFYGTTWAGGAHGHGSIFRTPVDNPTAVEAVYSFTGGADGRAPRAGLIQATDGQFFGTTTQGGENNRGVLFRMTSSGDVSVLHHFAAGEGSPGTEPRPSRDSTATSTERPRGVRRASSTVTVLSAESSRSCTGVSP